jgi:hypothetical protein
MGGPTPHPTPSPQAPEAPVDCQPTHPRGPSLVDQLLQQLHHAVVRLLGAGCSRWGRHEHERPHASDGAWLGHGSLVPRVCSLVTSRLVTPLVTSLVTSVL